MGQYNKEPKQRKIISAHHDEAARQEYMLRAKKKKQEKFDRQISSKVAELRRAESELRTLEFQHNRAVENNGKTTHVLIIVICITIFIFSLILATRSARLGSVSGLYWGVILLFLGISGTILSFSLENDIEQQIWITAGKIKGKQQEIAKLKKELGILKTEKTT